VGRGAALGLPVKAGGLLEGGALRDQSRSHHRHSQAVGVGRGQYLLEDTPVANLPPLTNDILAPAYPYNAGYQQDVNLVLGILPHVGESGLRAAFFQGHVEVLGLLPDGSFAPPVAAGTGGGIQVPAGVTTVAQAVTRFGVTEAALRAANPGLPPVNLPPRINVPGWREHVVVSSREGATETVETKDQIATQNGLVPADLDAANPGMAWGALAAGSIVLIPPH
jgi:hypothetical protein